MSVLATTGWTVGYVVAKEPWMTGLRKTTLYSTNGVSTPSQWAALAAMQIPKAELDRTRDLYRERRDMIIAGFAELGLPCPAPHGAFYAFPDVSRIDRDSKKAAAKLLDAAQVATVPGIVFGSHGEGHCRFSFSKEKDELRRSAGASVAGARRAFTSVSHQSSPTQPSALPRPSGVYPAF